MRISPRLALITLFVTCATYATPRVKVSETNPHFLSTVDNQPFFYLADTAWELFHRLNREQAERYLKNRADKRFTVIQAVLLAELDGLHTPNAYGQTPLANDDPTQPNEAYFQHVDWIVDKADELGLTIGMLPTWGDKWHKPLGQGGIFTPESARTYGQWVGNRYKDKPIIWILGGDRPIDSPKQLAIWRAMAKGLREGDHGRHLITYHTMGGHSSSESLHDEPWLDFNTLQSGHSERDIDAAAMIAKDYAKTPPKPTLDSEPCYEDHPVNWKPANGWFDEYDVRKAVYSSLFAGACGVTYGCHDVWQFWTPDREPISFARTPWEQALDLPGAGQMQFARKLLESRPYLTRIPDQSLIVSDTDARGLRAIATRDVNGSYSMIYFPTARAVTIDLSKLAGPVRATWFDPQTGTRRSVGRFDNSGPHEFVPNSTTDAILVLDVVKK
jgi:hypothetical protein